jgi:hypothetical protein
VTLKGRKSHHRALGPWALDSGGFTSLSTHGRWLWGADEYVDYVARYAEEIGNLAWAAPMDWMCEPFILEKTGKTVDYHQRSTVENFLALDGRGPFIPVLQGWEDRDYYRHVELYADAGIDLRERALVGIGSVCRRGGTGAAEEIIGTLTMMGIRLHGFGLKTTALRQVGYLLASSDSFAWSYRARRENVRLPGCEHRGRCAHCLAFALQWRERVLATLDVQQPALFYGAS